MQDLVTQHSTLTQIYSEIVNFLRNFSILFPSGLTDNHDYSNKLVWAYCCLSNVPTVVAIKHSMFLHASLGGLE